MNSLSIVIPAYNEEQSIQEVVRDALAVGAALSPDLEVVVCDDASTDGTGPILDRLAAADARVRVFHRRVNRGIEASIRALYASARKEYVFLISADRQWPMGSLPEMAEAIAEGADLVVGVRRDKPKVYTLFRRVLSHGYERIVRALGASVGDPGSIKLGRADALRVPVVSKNVFAEGERLIRAARAGYRLAERPVDFLPRRAGKAAGARGRVVAGALADVVLTLSSLILGWPHPESPRRDPDDGAG